MKTSAVLAAALVAAAPLAASAQAQAPAVPMVAMRQVPPASRQLRREAERLAQQGAVPVDGIRILRVRGYHGRIGADTEQAVSGTLGKVQVTQGSAQTYTNSPAPGSVSDWIGRMGYQPSDVVGMLVGPGNSLTLYVAK